MTSDSPRRPALAITSSQCVGAALTSAALLSPTGELREASRGRGERGDLAATVETLCNAAGVAPADIAEIRVDVGPGSYVGLRVSVTFVRFCAHFGGVEVLSATSLELMAVAAAEAGIVPTPTILPVLDARRDRFYCALVSAGHQGSTCDLLEDPAAVPLQTLLDRIGPGQTIVAAPALHERLSEAVSRAGAILVAPAAVDATKLFSPRLSPRRASLEQLAPLYLMASYAE